MRVFILFLAWMGPTLGVHVLTAMRLYNSTGASRVFVFDHRTRCGPSNWHSLGKGNTESRGPLLRAHVDQSYDGAEMVLRRWFPDEADDLVKRRYQIINVGFLTPINNSTR